MTPTTDRDLATRPNAPWRPFLWTHPAAIVPWVCATTSIGSLLLYLAGIVDLRTGARWLLLPGALGMVGFWIWVARTGRREIFNRLLHGCWAGLVATFFYDLVRVPIAMSGVPVFKAISYFGTVFLGQPAPTPASELVGWGYHLSNGVGFALLYALWMPRASAWTATLWGLVLEGVMLLTPYAEVFGYKMSRQFLAITIGAHVVYGLALWFALRWQEAPNPWLGRWPFLRHATVAGWIVVPVGLAVMAVDFHARHARTLTPSPPEYVGEHLYTTWNVFEPDRLAAMWTLARFVDRQARFHYAPPFTRITRGKLFDVPEAEIRRSGTRSATEVLLARHRLEGDPRLRLLGRMTHLYEITPWLIDSEPDAAELGRRLKAIVESHAGRPPAEVVAAAFTWLDEWHASSPSAAAPNR